jgi:hypothetical protein
MTRRKNNSEWSGGIAVHPAPINSEYKNLLEEFSLRFFGIKTSSSSLTIFQNINAKYCSSLLVQLKDSLKEKRGGNFTKRVLFLHYNAPAHRTLAIQKKMAYLGFQCLDHPTYSPEMAPSDYHLFPGLKKKL